jgi:Arc/MetJ family transcription regulator
LVIRCRAGYPSLDPSDVEHPARVVEDLAHLGAAADELVPGRFDVRDCQEVSHVCPVLALPRFTAAEYISLGHCEIYSAKKEAAMAKTLIEIDEQYLAAAQRELGTTTKKDTVNTALREVTALAARRRDLKRLTSRGLPDLEDEDVMRAAWQR